MREIFVLCFALVLACGGTTTPTTEPTTNEPLPNHAQTLCYVGTRTTQSPDGGVLHETPFVVERTVSPLESRISTVVTSAGTSAAQSADREPGTDTFVSRTDEAELRITYDQGEEWAWTHWRTEASFTNGAGSAVGEVTLSGDTMHAETTFNAPTGQPLAHMIDDYVAVDSDTCEARKAELLAMPAPAR